MSLKSIASNKMRSFLTMLGIIIGVMALVILVSITNGTITTVSDSINSLGTNTITVMISDDKNNPYTISTLDEIATDSENIAYVSPTATGSVTAYSSYSQNYNDDDSETASVTVTGSGSSYDEIMGLTVKSGRYFNITDVENHTYVVVINEDLAETIMGGTNCVGQTIKFDGISYEIIGVVGDEEDDEEDTSSSSLLGTDYTSYEAYMPYTSLLRLTDSVSSSISSFVVAPTSDDTIDAAETELELTLLSRFEYDTDAFTIQNTSVIADAMEEVTSVMSLMLGGIAAISLLVGGIGIMNIMLVSVTERTREIGIRKAIGAGRRTIMAQFLLEAIVLSLLGCAIGILASFLVVHGISLFTDYSFALSKGVVVIAIIFSTAIGIVFGIYPANKAAKKNPIDALRYTG